MGVLEKDVAKIANLAKLSLRSGEKKTFSKQLSRIIDYFNKLAPLKLEGVESLSHVIDLKNVLRNDEPKESLQTSEVLNNAPEVRQNMFKVPKVIP